jgi:ABC-2 type transport system permease protein
MRIAATLGVELVKMFRQRGTYAGYILLAAFIGLFIWGVWAEGPPMMGGADSFGPDMAVGGNLISGPLIPYLLLELPVAINVFMPLLISMIAGGLIAGEAQRGTLRTTLTRPVHRWVIVVGKALAAFIHAGSLVLFLGGVSLGAGYIVFGGGDIVSTGGIMSGEGGMRIFAEPQALQRLGLAYGLVMVTMFTVAALAVFCSTIFEHPLTAAGVTVGFLIVSAALMVIPYFEWLSPYLLTSHFNAFRAVFEKAVNWEKIARDMTCIVIYGAGAIAGTLVVFCNRDQTC